jgi:hypothetical protein
VTVVDTAHPTVQGTANVLVTPGEVSAFQVTGFPSPARAGSIHTYTVTALDAYGNTVTDYQGTVHFQSTDPRAILYDDYTFTADDAGRHTFFAAVTLFQAGFQTLTVEDLQDTTLKATGTIFVQPASVASFDVVAAGPVHAGEPFDLTVTARDAYGNVVTDYQGTVSLSSSFKTDNLPKSYAFTAGDAGSHTFSVIADDAGLLVIVVEDFLASASGSVRIHVKGRR